MSYAGKQVKVTFCSVVVALLFMSVACSRSDSDKNGEPLLSPAVLQKQCREIIGEPRVEKISPHVWLAIGYDLASTVLINTPVGNVIVDTGMSPARARL
ncbi:MAG: hypothetical protein PHY31_10145, partial [Smithellaceae bacterium]|nr:hypothetical protein [Smithellaceae bacterium]